MTTEHLLTSAVEAARAALADATDDASVGEHLRAVVEDDGQVWHYFASTQPGYRGWNWAVSLVALPGDAAPTVNDVVLLPGDDAIVAPAWTPYRDRIRPGDLGPGDVLPPDDDDLRLVPSWSAGDGEEQTADRFFAREVGLGREWVLSAEGRDMAAQRWNDGPQGADAPIAQQASGVCRSCGFLVSLAGPLADRFGVCANGMANDDAKVVSFDHGCGAHSGARLSRSAAPRRLPPPVFDTVTVDDVEQV